MTFEARIEPGSMDYDLLRKRVEAGAPVVLKCQEPWAEALFVHGDQVRVEFDDGPGPATVQDTFTLDGAEYVRLRYGPNGKYTTSLPRSAISTDRRREYPARVEVTD
jgi:hypothetical protein